MKTSVETSDWKPAPSPGLSSSANKNQVMPGSSASAGNQAGLGTFHLIQEKQGHSNSALAVTLSRESPGQEAECQASPGDKE